VTTTENGSSVPRRQLGRKLKELREGAELTAVDSARALEWSKQRLWRYEGGQVSVHPNDVDIMCRLYGADPETTEGLKALARETKAKGWWHDYSEIHEWFQLFLGMESASSRLRQYEAEIIPGLLQTPQYAKAVISLGPDELSLEAVEERVAIRIQRQRILTRRKPTAPRLEVILSETALVRGFSPEIMTDQLSRLITVSELPNVSVRVIPFTAGPHTAYQGPFVILEFPRESPTRDPEPKTVYEESPTGSLYLDKPNEVETYSSIWADLDRVALDQAESRRLIEQKVKEWSR
jgi:transcriptional regulator with XRE-family HTH domain